jgi:hypothetical protein
MRRSHEARDDRSTLTALHYPQSGLLACAYRKAAASTSGTFSTQAFRCRVARITSHESGVATNTPRIANHRSLLTTH